jgi:hypothetical protein
MLRIWNRFRQKLHEVRSLSGWRGVARWIFDRIGHRFVNLQVTELVWLDADRAAKLAQPTPGFEFRFLDAAEVADFSTDPGNDLGSGLAGRIDGGLDDCFAALEEGRLAAYGWYARESIEPVHFCGVALSYPSTVAYMYKGFTHPDYRGKRLHGAAMALALISLQSRGVTALISAVDWLNAASLKSCDRLGYVRLGRLVTLGWGRWKYCRYPRPARGLGVRFGAEAKIRRPIRLAGGRRSLATVAGN